MSAIALDARSITAALVQGKRSSTRALALDVRNPSTPLVTAFIVNADTGHYFNSRFSDRFKKL